MSDEMINRLEMKISYLEKNLDELNTAFYGQRKELDRLTAQNAELTRRVKHLSEILEENRKVPNPSGERPPHY